MEGPVVLYEPDLRGCPLTLLDREIAIPFDAFAPARDEVAAIDVLADEIDGSVVAVEPARSAAAPVPQPALAAFRDRCVLGIEADPAAADGFVDRLLDGLAMAEHVGPATYASRSHVHHDPADLPYWAEVDAARGRLATALDIVVCTQRLGSPQRAYVTVDAPAGLLGTLASVAARLAEVASTALLTSAGAFTTQPSGSSLVLAAATHAGRLGGRADAFPGQQWLIDDLPVTEVLARTAIDEIRSTQGEYAAGALLRAHGFVRPGYESGALVLRVGHDDPLVVTPWEVRYCRPCCSASLPSPSWLRPSPSDSSKSLSR